MDPPAKPKPHFSTTLLDRVSLGIPSIDSSQHEKLYEKYLTLGSNSVVAELYGKDGCKAEGYEYVVCIEPELLDLHAFLFQNRHKTKPCEDPDYSIPSAGLVKMLKRFAKGISDIHEKDWVVGNINAARNVFVDAENSMLKIKSLEAASYLGCDVALQTKYNGFTKSKKMMQVLFVTERKSDLMQFGSLLSECLLSSSGVRTDEKTVLISPEGNYKDLDVKLSPYPEALNLLECIQNGTLTTGTKIAGHPFFWSSRKKMAFIEDIGEKVKLLSKIPGNPHNLILKINSLNGEFSGWGDKVTNMGFPVAEACPDTVAELVKFARNKSSHRQEIHAWVFRIENMKVDLGKGRNLQPFFSHHFPQLIIQIHKTIKPDLEKNRVFNQYF